MALNRQNNPSFFNYSGTSQRTVAAQNDTVTVQQSQQTTQANPGPIPYTQPNTQTFDDGSTLTTNADGTVTSTPAPEPTAPDSQQPAAASATDDSGKVSNSVQTSTIIDTSSALGNPVIPQANVLDSYASYTYSISWYALTPAQFTALQNSGKVDSNSWSLLMQSGGAQANTNRNKYFNLDYYLDDLEINTAFMNGAPSNVTDIQFTVTEPNGLTLLQNLDLALRDLLKQPTGSVAQNAQYCLVIRFYGYDSLGNLVTNLSPSAANPTNPLSTSANDSSTVIVKYIPFTINEFTFEMANRAVRYTISGQPVQYIKNSGSALGSVPFNLELNGVTVDDVLNGKVITNASATDTTDRGSTNTSSAQVQTGPQQPQVDSAQTAALFNGDPNYDPAAGWGGG